MVMTSIDHQPWRWLLGISALPLLVMILLFPVSEDVKTSLWYVLKLFLYPLPHVYVGHQQEE